MSVTMGDFERGAQSSNNSPRSSFHKLFPRRSNASFHTSSFRTSKTATSGGGSGSSSFSHKFRGSLSKLQLVKTFSLSNKATYQHDIDMEVMDRNDDCDVSKSSNRSSVDFSRRDSKFQVEILLSPEDKQSKIDNSEDEGAKFKGQNRLTPWLLNLPQQHRLNPGDVTNQGTSQGGPVRKQSGNRRSNDCSMCSNDYPEEEGDTITSLKSMFTRNM